MEQKESNKKKSDLYLQRLEELTTYARQLHARILAFRLDLYLPMHNYHSGYNSIVITHFIASLKAQIAAYQTRRKKQGKRVYPCSLLYAWVREFGEINNNKHYHLLILVNREVFHRAMLDLGYRNEGRGLLLLMVLKAWRRALKIRRSNKEEIRFYLSGIYELNRRDTTDTDYYRGYLQHINYLAKVHTKTHDDGERNFGCSLIRGNKKVIYYRRSDCNDGAGNITLN